MKTAVVENVGKVADEEEIFDWFWTTHPDAHTVYPDDGVFEPSVYDKTYKPYKRSEVLAEFKAANPDAEIRVADPLSFGMSPRVLKLVVSAGADYIEDHPVASQPNARIVPPTGNRLPICLIEAVLKADCVKLALGLLAHEGAVNDRVAGPTSPTLLHLAAAMYSRYCQDMRATTATYPKGPLCGSHYERVCKMLLNCGADPQAWSIRPNSGPFTMPDTPVGWCDGFAPKVLKDRSMVDAKQGLVDWRNDRNTSHAERGYH